MRTVSLSGPRVPAAQGKAEYLVVLCHGYGADGNDLISLAPHWQRMLPKAAFVAPNAPERCAMAPTGRQWFPISRLTPDEMWQGVQAAAPTLNAFIDQELDRLGLDESRLGLVGFSQGTMMSLHIGLRRDPGPAAIVGYSGTLAGAEHLKDEIRARPPVMLIHGDRDEMIPPTAMLAAAQALGEAGVSVQWHLSQGVGHAIDPDGLFLGGRFLADAYAGSLGAHPVVEAG
jgi:phospholipase/carboxylesterase